MSDDELITIPNPDRQPWQFWKAKTVTGRYVSNGENASYGNPQARHF